MISHIPNVREMKKCDKDKDSMGTLIGYDTNTGSERKEKKKMQKQIYVSWTSCVLHLFLEVYATRRKRLENLLKHMGKNGAVPPIHGNCEYSKENLCRLVIENIKAAVQFIVNNVDTCDRGLPQLATTCANAYMAIPHLQHIPALPNN